jgi:acetyltransferase-like isoleucine patch superfamily enzyme
MKLLKLLWRFYYKSRKFFRKKIYTYIVKSKANKVGIELKVNGRSSVTPKTSLGDNVNFNGMRIIGKGKVVIGNNFHSGTGCLIMTSWHNYDHGEAIPYDSTYIHKDVKIEDNVWLGNNVTILGGVTIGEGAIIQIESVVVSDIPALAIAGGHPAKVYSYRDKEHYNELKQQGKFH